jgi:hypothetical protein
MPPAVVSTLIVVTYQGCTSRSVFAKKSWVRPGCSKISSGRSLPRGQISRGYPGISPGGLVCQKILKYDFFLKLHHQLHYNCTVGIDINFESLSHRPLVPE